MIRGNDSGNPQMSAGKQLLEKLIFMGRNEDSIDIEGVTFTITSLSEKQNRELLEKLFELSDGERISQTKSIAVATAISKINEYPIETVLSEINIEGSDFDKKLHLVSTMQASVVGQLYDFFEKINTKVGAEEASEDLKNS